MISPVSLVAFRQEFEKTALTRWQKEIAAGNFTPEMAQRMGDAAGHEAAYSPELLGRKTTAEYGQALGPRVANEATNGIGYRHVGPEFWDKALDSGTEDAAYHQMRGADARTDLRQSLRQGVTETPVKERLENFKKLKAQAAASAEHVPAAGTVHPSPAAAEGGFSKLLKNPTLRKAAPWVAGAAALGGGALLAHHMAKTDAPVAPPPQPLPPEPPQPSY